MNPNSIPSKARDFFESAQPPFQWAPVELSSSLKRPGREADPSPPLSAVVQNAWSSTALFAVFPSCCCTIVTQFVAQNKYLILRRSAPVMYIMWKQYNLVHYISIIIDLYKIWRATRRLNESRFVIGHPGMLCGFCWEVCGANHRCAPVPGNLSVPNRSVDVFKRFQKILRVCVCVCVCVNRSVRLTY